MKSVQTDGTIEITIVENPHAHIQNIKFPNRKKVRFTEFNLRISAEYMFLYIGRYKALYISGQYKPQA